jgi:hypothetical protein
MTPTPKLRFVIRYEPTPVRILQQWWEDPAVVLSISIDWNGLTQKRFAGEWRDVPLEKEQA